MVLPKPDRNVINETEKKIFLTDFSLASSRIPLAKFMKEKNLALLYFPDILLKRKEILDQ